VPSDGEEAERIAAKWVPATRQLVGFPGSDRMLPAIFIPSLEKQALQSARRSNRNNLIAHFLLFVAFGVLALVVQDPRAAGLAAMALLLLFSFSYDHVKCVSSPDGLKERALFLFALRDPKQNALRGRFWLTLALAFGATQVLVMWTGGSLAYAFQVYGFLYDEVEAGSWWRVLTGPYLHYSLLHYAVNLCLLVIAGSLASLLAGTWSLLLFLMAASITGLAQWALGPDLLGSFGGISGGIYSLFGLVIGIHLLDNRRMPKGLAMLVITVTATAIISVELLTDTAASIAHVSGTFLGLAAALLWKGVLARAPGWAKK